MISVLPQLPCENRYTEDWIRVWTRELRNLDVPFIMLGDDKAVPVTKYFTDPKKALDHEANQIRLLCNIPPMNIFCLDVEFPGLISPAIQALRLMNSGLKAYGYLHAGSWCNGDVWSDTPGRYPMDRVMFDVFNKIFVASNYHKNKIQDYYGEEFDNVEVVGFPFYKQDVLDYVSSLPFKEKHGILINGRVEQSNIEIVDVLRKRFSDQKIQFVNAKSRAEYYSQLNQAKVVLSLKTEETFGIGPLEAYTLGGIPLSPNKFAYSEVISDERLLYEGEDDLMDKLDYLLQLEKNPFHIDIEKYEQTIAKCVKGMV